MTPPRVACLIALVLLTSRIPAAAQQRFVSGGVMASVQNTPALGGANPSVPEDGVGGHAVGGTAVAGVFVSSRVGIGVELGAPSSLEAEQTAAKYLTRIHHRDLIVSGLLLFRPRSTLPEWSAGVSYVRQHTERRVALLDSVRFVYGPFGEPPEAIDVNGVGVTAGVGWPFRIAPHVSIDPRARLHLIRRGDSDPTLGLGSRVWGASIGVRADF